VLRQNKFEVKVFLLNEINERRLLHPRVFEYIADHMEPDFDKNLFSKKLAALKRNKSVFMEEHWAKSLIDATNRYDEILREVPPGMDEMSIVATLEVLTVPPMIKVPMVLYMRKKTIKEYRRKLRKSFSVFWNKACEREGKGYLHAKIRLLIDKELLKSGNVEMNPGPNVRSSDIMLDVQTFSINFFSLDTYPNPICKDPYGYHVSSMTNEIVIYNSHSFPIKVQTVYSKGPVMSDRSNITLVVPEVIMPKGQTSQKYYMGTTPLRDLLYAGEDPWITVEVVQGPSITLAVNLYADYDDNICVDRNRWIKHTPLMWYLFNKFSPRILVEWKGKLEVKTQLSIVIPPILIGEYKAALNQLCDYLELTYEMIRVEGRLVMKEKDDENYC